MQNPIIRCVCLAFAGALLIPWAIQAQQQQRDHLTEMEGDLIRETAPILDQRIEVFIKAADRRLLVLTNPNATQKKKEEEKWGPLPQGSQFELITDIKNLLSEAMEKLDDANERKDPLLAKALNKFKEAAVRQIAEMKALAPKITEAKAQRALAEAIAEAEVASKGSLQ